MLLKAHYRHYQFLSEQVQTLEAEIERRMQPYARQIAALQTIPGVDQIVAWHLLAEMGPDMSVFPDADHCASWAGVSPGSCESGGNSGVAAPKEGTSICGES